MEQKKIREEKEKERGQEDCKREKYEKKEKKNPFRQEDGRTYCELQRKKKVPTIDEKRTEREIQKGGKEKETSLILKEF